MPLSFTMSPADYHAKALGTVSKTGLDYVARSPRHYKAWIDGDLEDEDSPALAFGRAMHCGILEPDRFAADYVTAPDFGDCRVTANKQARNEWRAANESKSHLSADDARTIGAMARAVWSHPLAKRLLGAGKPEVTVTWNDPETGLPCKSRADYYVAERELVVDVKSTLDASATAFRRDVSRYGYHRQDALYRAGFAANGRAVKHFVFVAVEKTPPYAVAVFSLDEDAIARGLDHTRRCIETLAHCVSTNTWPGYPDGIQEINLPPWG